MGAPGVELPRDTIRPACGVAHVVSLTGATATLHPRPIGGSGFYATACFFRSSRQRVCSDACIHSTNRPIEANRISLGFEPWH